MAEARRKQELANDEDDVIAARARHPAQTTTDADEDEELGEDKEETIEDDQDLKEGRKPPTNNSDAVDPDEEEQLATKRAIKFESETFYVSENTPEPQCFEDTINEAINYAVHNRPDTDPSKLKMVIHGDWQGGEDALRKAVRHGFNVELDADCKVSPEFRKELETIQQPRAQERAGQPSNAINAQVEGQAEQKASAPKSPVEENKAAPLAPQTPTSQATATTGQPDVKSVNPQKLHSFAANAIKASTKADSKPFEPDVTDPKKETSYSM